MFPAQFSLSGICDVEYKKVLDGIAVLQFFFKKKDIPV